MKRRKNQGDAFTKALRRLILIHHREAANDRREGRPVGEIINGTRKKEVQFVLDLYEEFKGWK